MRNLFFLLLIFLCFQNFAFNTKTIKHKYVIADSFPIQQNLGSVNTIVNAPGAVRTKLVNQKFTDTTAANLTQIKNYSGAQIFTIDNTIWVRNNAGTQWIRQASTSSIVPPSVVNYIDATHFSICNVNSCDTITTTINPQIITIINDSTIRVCDYTGACETININPTPLIPSGKFVDTVFVRPATKTDSLYQGKGGVNSLVNVFDRNCGLISGGIVTYDSLLIFSISPAIYRLCSDGVRRTSVQTNITLSAADNTFNRFDAIILDSNGVNKITGTPSADPVQPQINTDQILLTYILVAVGDTTPTEIINCTTPDQIPFDENLGAPNEYTHTNTVTANFSATATPYHLLKYISVGSYVGGENIIFTPPTSIAIRSYTYLKFALRTNFVMQASNQLQISWVTSAGTSSVTVSDGLYGFNRNTTGSYQIVTIPISDFTASNVGTAFQMTVPSAVTLKITFVNKNTHGLLIDYIQLGGGCITQPSSSNIYTASTRTGTGAPVLAGTVGNDFQFKRVVGISPIVVTNYADSITVSGGGGSSVINIINDTTFNICSFGTNLCDTFVTTNNTIQTITILNDSTLLICDSVDVCDTVHLGSSYNFYSGVGDPSFIVAASNSPSILKNRADYICDGVNDEAEINTALALGNVQLVEGTYNISHTIVLPANRTLSGTGKSSRLFAVQMSGTFEPPPSSTNTMIRNSGSNNIVIKNLTLEGDYSTLTPSSRTAFGMLFTTVGSGTGNTAVQGITVSGVHFKGFGSTGIKLKDCHNNLITGNEFVLVNQDGITLTRTTGTNRTSNTTISHNIISGGLAAVFITYASDILVEENICTGQSEYNMQFDYPQRVTVNGNRLVGAQTYAGIKAMGDADSKVIILTNNIIDSSLGIGAQIIQMPNSVISNNTITNSANEGLWVETSDNSTVEGNTIVGNGLAANNTYSGIYSWYNINVLFSGNNVKKGTATNKQKYGIEVYGGTPEHSTGEGNDFALSGETAAIFRNVPTTVLTIRDNKGLDGTWIKTDSVNTPTNILWENPTTHERYLAAYPTAGLTAITADNGLTANTSSNVELGGTLLQNTTIDATASYNLLITGSSNSQTFKAYNTGGGGALFAWAQGAGTGVVGQGGTAGVQGISEGAFGAVSGQTTAGVAFYANLLGSTNNTVQTAIKIARQTPGTAANGVGSSIDFNANSTTTLQLANQIISKWTDATNTTRTSSLVFTGILSATTVNLLTLAGDGSMTMRPITAAAASAITPAEGMILIVNTTDGTFTSTGFWGYSGGAWGKISN